MGLLTLVYGFLIEPKWIVVREIDITNAPSHRIVHISDIHFKGDRNYLVRAIGRINDLSPDFVCITGDLAEEKKYMDEVLGIIKQIRQPVFGVLGNHDPRNKVSLAAISACFESTGGALVGDHTVVAATEGVLISGPSSKVPAQDAQGTKRIVLAHFPSTADWFAHESFDLMLAGHSHGGQARIPLWGALIVPHGTGKYEKGYYQTKGGPLYVNVGIGTWLIPVRFFCRPEITVIRF
jgi:predicted MPP superfamily phosphohydrolase